MISWTSTPNLVEMFSVLCSIAAGLLLYPDRFSHHITFHMRWLGIGGSEVPTANITQNMQVGRFTNLISSFSVRGDSNDMQTGPFMVMFLAVNDYHSVFPAITTT